MLPEAQDVLDICAALDLRHDGPVRQRAGPRSRRDPGDQPRVILTVRGKGYMLGRKDT